MTEIALRAVYPNAKYEMTFEDHPTRMEKTGQSLAPLPVETSPALGSSIRY
ncbi:MAG: hypothetical protein IH956_03645 [Chloroflexi bacterium]|nr:hypothetical protein [Chloroflexota bacterium]